MRNGTTQYPSHSLDTVQPGQTVSISCDVDYELFGRSRITCIAGDKTSDMPFCRRKCKNQNLKSSISAVRILVVLMLILSSNKFFALPAQLGQLLAPLGKRNHRDKTKNHLDNNQTNFQHSTVTDTQSPSVRYNQPLQHG